MLILIKYCERQRLQIKDKINYIFCEITFRGKKYSTESENYIV